MPSVLEMNAEADNQDNGSIHCEGLRHGLFSDDFRHKPCKTLMNLCFFFLGRFPPNKGQHHLVKIAKAFVSEVDAGFLIRMVGPMDSELERYRREIVAIIASLGLQKHVQIWEHCSDDEALRLFQRSDVYLTAVSTKGFVSCYRGTSHRFAAWWQQTFVRWVKRPVTSNCYRLPRRTKSTIRFTLGLINEP